ncbi:hypothetical protein ACEPAF_6749 [Sanghuangporus sanghuang]|uniref:Translation initiation factor IF-3 n=1 Tax=Sanghuangporus baumii TaxID=108892 RepID=A0A9Q5HRC9_SANBA|nr:hypothetical protein A7U60_g8569 [Sanghuangporus baumii]
MLVRPWTRLFIESPPKLRVTRSQAIRSFSSCAALFKHIKGPRDNGIKIPTVQLVDENNKLCPPEPLEDILGRVKQRTHYVELVQKDPPIVKIGSRETEREARKAAKTKERPKVSKMERKEIQVTWNVTDSDLDHKIKKAREQLDRNNLVDFAFAPKANHRPPPVQAMEERLEKVVDALQDIARERQDRTLDRGVGIVFLRLDKSKAERIEESD